MKIKLGISTCPNDTFLFHAILKKKIDLDEVEFSTELLDVQELNRRLATNSFDCAKASFFAALGLADRYVVSPVGSALGVGVGPILISGKTLPPPTSNDEVLCPGEQTTAYLLLRSLFPEIKKIKHVHFAEIMPALQSGEAKFGVVIHEGRFVYKSLGFTLVQDLGAEWERVTAGPVPLGGILVSKKLPPETAQKIVTLLRSSLTYAFAHPEAAFQTMQQYAQHESSSVIWKHVELYVNSYTHELGPVGKRALQVMGEYARQRGLISVDTPELCVL